VFYLFEVRDMRKTRAFISAHDAARAAFESGVIEGEYHFIQDEKIAGYRRPM
jgi:hypothetical protein